MKNLFLLSILLVLSFSVSAQITKELHKSFRPELDNVYVLNVPYGTEVEQIASKASTVQIEYTVSVNSNEQHIAKFLFDNYAPTPVLIDGFVEGQIDISMILTKQHIFIAGKDIEIRVDKIRIFIPESINTLIVKQAI